MILLLLPNITYYASMYYKQFFFIYTIPDRGTENVKPLNKKILRYNLYDVYYNIKIPNYRYSILLVSKYMK